MSAPTHTLPQAATNQPGFYLWVGLNQNESDTTAAAYTSPAQIIEIAEALGELARELLPSAETHTTLALGESEQTTHDRTRATQTRHTAPSLAPRRQAAPETQSNSTNAIRATSTRPAPLGAQRYQAPYTERRPSPNTQRATYGDRYGSARNEVVETPISQSVPNFDFVFSPRVIIDLHNRRVIADEEIQRLTYKEFELLAHLVNSPGRIISRDELFTSVWRTAIHNDSRTIDVHIRRLREKLGLENHIITVRGSGYKFELTEQIDVIPPAPRSLHR